MNPMFKAILLSKDGDKFQARVADVDEKDLPEGDVTLKVEYSTINYKDALAITNKSPIVRRWPMVAGIDAVGVVEASSHPAWKRGERAILTGWGVGESHWGGLAQKLRVNGDWLVKIPSKTTLVRVKGDSMIDAGIREGDLLIVEVQPNANVGDIVVAIVDNEFTIKELAREKSAFVLKPANKAYPVLRPKGGFEIFGVMAGLARRTR